ncbi:hypothetical protein [Persephonella sp.]
MVKRKLQILDIYSDSFGIHIWLLSEDGKRFSVFRRFRPYFYIGEKNSKDALKLLIKRFGKKIKIEKVLKKDLLKGELQVYKVTANTPFTYLKAVHLLRKNRVIEDTDIYNIQLTPAQIFMYEKKIFPFCTVEPVERNGKVMFRKIDSAERTDYRIFDLRIMRIKPDIEGGNPKFMRHIPPLYIEMEGESGIVLDDGNLEYLSQLLKKKTLIS